MQKAIQLLPGCLFNDQLSITHANAAKQFQLTFC